MKKPAKWLKMNAMNSLRSGEPSTSANNPYKQQCALWSDDLDRDAEEDDLKN